MSKMSKLRLLLSLVAVLVSTGACGGQQQEPAETAAPPQKSTEPSSAEGTEPSSTEGSGAGEEGEHTMPDGGKMPGHHHEGGE